MLLAINWNTITLSVLFLLVLYISNLYLSLAYRLVLILLLLPFELHSLSKFLAILVPDVPESYESDQITDTLVCHYRQVETN